jgi:hypothetical protein
METEYHKALLVEQQQGLGFSSSLVFFLITDKVGNLSLCHRRNKPQIREVGKQFLSHVKAAVIEESCKPSISMHSMAD